MTPAALAREATARLGRLARHPPRRATRFFKPWERVYGVGLGAAEVRGLARALSAQVRKTWTLADAIAFADRMLRGRTWEARSVGLIVLSKFHRHFDARVLDPRATAWR